ncbi:hypothetical protein [Sulfitobacter aestuariivivens]|uniref:Uncharacterized protein n=1 Tax=Sulfitobacter aestuariivivens TaxID=2766981 RepID=A0A927CZZ7_9RHOB|nr:hypothetical protein [Sulfitobacter aestuariivivens]MBD3662520.1 hypothetical protein [Sulfitobacter aestuariivivens]
MRFLILALMLLLLPLTSAQAQAYRAENLLIVVPLGGTTFEVIESRGEGPRGIWCAAASFAIHALRTPRAERLYVKTPRGPSVSGVGRTSVVFTTDPAGIVARDTYSPSLRQAGQTLPVHHAYQFCKDYQFELEDIFP